MPGVDFLSTLKNKNFFDIFNKICYNNNIEKKKRGKNL